MLPQMHFGTIAYRNDFNPILMLPLPDTYRKNGYDYRLYDRTGDVAVFEQYSDGKLIAYEVFEVQKNKEWASFGQTFPAKESVPPSTAWGSKAFTCKTPEQAAVKQLEILSSIKQAVA